MFKQKQQLLSLGENTVCCLDKLVRNKATKGHVDGTNWSSFKVTKVLHKVTKVQSLCWVNCTFYTAKQPDFKANSVVKQKHLTMISLWEGWRCLQTSPLIELKKGQLLNLYSICKLNDIYICVARWRRSSNFCWCHSDAHPGGTHLGIICGKKGGGTHLGIRCGKKGGRCKVHFWYHDCLILCCHLLLGFVCKSCQTLLDSPAIFVIFPICHFVRCETTFKILAWGLSNKHLYCIPGPYNMYNISCCQQIMIELNYWSQGKCAL